MLFAVVLFVIIVVVVIGDGVVVIMICYGVCIEICAYNRFSAHVLIFLLFLVLIC